jgi:hypothetical protein
VHDSEILGMQAGEDVKPGSCASVFRADGAAVWGGDSGGITVILLFGYVLHRETAHKLITGVGLFAACSRLSMSTSSTCGVQQRRNLHRYVNGHRFFTRRTFVPGLLGSIAFALP